MSFRSFAVIPPRPVTYSVGLESVLSIINILLMIGAVEDNYGLSPWVAQVERQMTADERETHLMLLHLAAGEGLTDVIEAYPETRDDFPAFLTLLETVDAVWLRDVLIYRMFHSLHLRVYIDKEGGNTRYDIDKLLNDETLFAKVIEHEFDGSNEPSMTSKLYSLIQKPPDFRLLLVSHLRMMWERFLADEWQRLRPALETSVAQYRGLELDNLSPFEAMQQITGRDLRGVYSAEELNKLSHIVFVPAKHNGPYVCWFGNDETMYLFFAARSNLSERPVFESVLDVSGFLDAVTALGDETRLRILIALKMNQKMNTQEIMQAFDLNKSAASRHLRQLYANSLIDEQRDHDNKTKIYSLSRTGVEKVMLTLQSTLLD